jgi:flagellar biosynthetic protein FliR
MDFSPLARFAVLLIRPGMLIAVAPGIGGAFLPTPAKIGLTVFVALGLLPAVSIPSVGAGTTLTALIARELAIGLALSLALRALVSGVEFAGFLSGYQIGFSYGATIDPQSGVSNTMLATFYAMLATMALLAVNGHHMLLRALAESYRGLPIGTGGIDQSLLVAVRDLLGLVFVVGARLAAPIVIVLLVVEVAVGLVSRVSPILNFMVIGYPIRLVVGLIVLALLVPTIPAVVTSLLEGTLALAARTAVAFR